MLLGRAFLHSVSGKSKNYDFYEFSMFPISNCLSWTYHQIIMWENMDRKRAWLTESTLSSGEDVNLFSLSVIDNSYSYIFVYLTYFNYWGGNL